MVVQVGTNLRTPCQAFIFRRGSVYKSTSNLILRIWLPLTQGHGIACPPNSAVARASWCRLPGQPEPIIRNGEISEIDRWIAGEFVQLSDGDGFLRLLS